LYYLKNHVHKRYIGLEKENSVGGMHNVLRRPVLDILNPKNYQMKPEEGNEHTEY